MPTKDPAKKRAQQLAWQKRKTAEDPAYREKRNAASRAWYAANRETQREKNRIRIAELRAKDPQLFKERANEWMRTHRDRTKQHQRKKYLKSAYGIAPDVVASMFDSQAGLCAICCCRLGSDSKSAMHIDHDHATGVVRGLLCVRCNIGIGMFDENADSFQRAIAYLKRGK